MALITNHHVIPTAQEALASRITFENVFPGRKCTLKGCDIFIKDKEAFRCNPDSKVCTLTIILWLPLMFTTPIKDFL